MTGKALTVALNPSLDKTVLVDGFGVDGIHTARSTAAVPGGKANNVARVLRVLGHSVRATGFAAGMTGRWIRNGLTSGGVEAEFIDVPGETRTCITIIDEERGTTTELRERGPHIPQKAQDELLARLPSLAEGCSVAVVSGSSPPGIEPKFVGELVAELRALGCAVLLDTSGPALAGGLQGKPSLIKPNEDELAAFAEAHLAGDEAESVGDLRRAADPNGGRTAGLVRMARETARRYGVDVVLSLGGGGAYWAKPDGRGLRASAPSVRAVNAVGAGDSLVAGLAAGMLQELEWGPALQLGVASGTASVLNYEVALVEPGDVERLLGEISLKGAGGAAADPEI